jgi:hypothetical protein
VIRWNSPKTTTKRYRFKKSKTQKQNNKTCENCDPMKLELSYIQNTQQRKAWPQRGGESTLTVSHTCHRPRIPFGHVLIERRCAIKHYKREGATKKRKTNPPQTTKKVPFQKHNIKITAERVRSVIRWNSSCRIFKIHNTQQRKAWPQRGRESTLTVCHICHRPRTPFGHVLIERRCGFKHCKTGCNKEKKDQPTTNNNKRYQSNTKTKITKRVRIVIRWNSSCSIFKRHNSGRRGQTEGERVHLLPSILVTAPVFHFDTSWLNTDAV